MAFVSGGKRPGDLTAAFLLQQQQQQQQQQHQQQPMQRSAEEDAARLLMEMNAQQAGVAAAVDARAPTPRMQAMTGQNVGVLGPNGLTIPYSFLNAAQQPTQPQPQFAAASHPNLAAAAAMLNPQAQAALVAAQGQQQAQAQAQQAAQLQLALSQVLLNPAAIQGQQQLAAAQLNANHLAQLLNPATANAMALYYGQLAALIQQQQQQVQAAAQMASAVVNQQQPKSQQPSQHEQALLLQQAQAQAAAVVAAAGGARQIAQDIRPLPPVQTTPVNGTVLQQRPLGPMASPEAVKDHISRLISENEAILEPNPVLLKRRPYHRQPVGPQSSVNSLIDQGSSSQCNSPGFPSVAGSGREKTPATRSQSLFEPFLPHDRLLQDAVVRGSLTSGQPVKGPEKALTCNYCPVKFPNEASLQAHEFRCSRKNDSLLISGRAAGSSVPTEALLAAVSQSPALEGGRKTSDVVSPPNGTDNRHPLKKRLLAATAAAAADALHEEEQKKAKIPRVDLASPPVGVHLPVASHLPTKRNSIGSIEQLQPAAAAAVAALAQLGQQHGGRQEAPTARRPSMPATMVRPQPIASNVLMAAAAANPAKSAPNATAMAAAALALQAQQAHLAQQAKQPTAVPSSMQPAVSLSATELNMSFKPYCLTLTQSTANPADMAATSPKVRNRPRHITMETFVCLKRPQPMFVQQKDRLSMYSNWQQLPVNPLEAKLNLLWMGTCSTKARRGVKPYWRYTTANKELGVLRMTHSSFWEISNKMRRQTQALLLNQKLSAAVVSSTATASTASSVTERDARLAGTSIEVKLEPKQPDDRPIIASSSTSKHISDLPALARKSASTNAPGAGELKDESAADATRGMSRKAICLGGYRTDDVYVYVRGRGRGRYVCERCGIRCKKPSMLKKHIRSHTDVRPFKCQRCNFSFKTKGNLTKHLQSKSHRRRLADPNGTQDDNGHDSDSENDRLEIASPAPSDETNSIDDVESDCSTDNEEEKKAKEIFSPIQPVPYRQYGQENTLVERNAHTPPTLWYCRTVNDDWPRIDVTRATHSAPPAAQVSPDSRRRRRRHSRARKVTDAGRSTPSTPFDDADSYKNTDVTSTPSSSSAAQSKATTATADTTVSNGGGGGGAVPNQLSAWMAQDRQTICETCGKEFRKPGDLSIHRQTHIFAKQSQSRSRYCYPCPHCNLPMRSKPLLHKHLDTCHPNAPLPDGWDERPMPREDHQSSSDADDKVDVRGVPTSSPLAAGRSNPRPFVCTDCDTGFRIHGHLAKHLRSKMHVMKLESQDKLPEGAFHLFETNSASLNDIDTTDCARARSSLLALFQSLSSADRQKAPSSASTATVDLNCAEEMLAPSPAPETPRKRCESLSVRALDVTPRRRCESMSVGMSMPSKEHKVELTGEDDAPTGLTNKAVTANVWVPPKAEHVAESKRPASLEMANGTLAVKLLLDAAAAAERGVLKSSGGDEASDVRSESSTPNHKISTASSTGGPGLSIRPTQCRFCDAFFDTPNELEVHLHADHIVMRDGNDFKCPRKHCDKVYPNRENLRHHIAAHYHGGGANLSDGREEHRDATMAPVADVSPETMVALHRKLTGTSSNHVASAPGHSPGAPEESHTTRQKSVKTHLVKLDSIPECVGALSTNSPTTDFKSPPSLNNSPLSVGGESSDSRNSSRQSASPLGAIPSLSNGLGTGGRLLMKRKSIDEAGSPSKRPATSTPPGQRCSSTVSVDMARSLSTPTVVGQGISPSLQRDQQAQIAQWLVATQACMPSAQQSMLATYLMQMQQLGAISHHPPLEAQASTTSDVSQSSSDGSPLTTAASPSSNGASQLPCAICSKIFDNPVTLQQHWMTHVCDRPHVCRLCDAGFTTMDALNLHLSTHQPQTNNA